MSIKNILCAYSGDAARGSGLDHAIKLARQYDAHLTGVLRYTAPSIERRFGMRLPDDLINLLHENDRSRIEDVTKRFGEKVAAAGLTEKSTFLELSRRDQIPLSHFARAFDLIVTGVHSDATDEDHLSAHPDLIALHSGRPVLVVPNGYTAEGLAERVLVAWDGRRAVARAVGDAMDVLAEKVGVTLVTVGETPQGTETMLENLRRHGVTAEARTVERSGSIAETLLQAAAADDAKLIVMGAFEHSKFTHDLMGGVTTDLTAIADVPVFMAH
ncbi:MAG: universal stress protein [Pseudomonadota bacterium]